MNDMTIIDNRLAVERLPEGDVRLYVPYQAKLNVACTLPAQSVAAVVDCLEPALRQSAELLQERCELLTRALNGIYTLVSGDTLPAGVPASTTLDALLTELGVRGGAQ